MKFNIYHVKINAFYRLYEDLIGSISGALSDLGHSCTVNLNGFDPGAINILIGSTIFASRYNRLPANLHEKQYIIYQLEILDDSHGLLKDWPEYWDLLKNATAIWDYSPNSTDYLRKKGFKNVFHVPPAFHRCLQVFQPRSDPDIDVLFFGSQHRRRDVLIDTLRSRGLKVVNLRAVFGASRDRHIARSKIVINVHAWNNLHALETVRLSFLLANQTFVISEKASHNPYSDGVVYGAYEELADLCGKYLGMGAEARREIAFKGYTSLKSIDMAEIIGETLQAMDIKTTEASSSVQKHSGSYYYSQPRLDILKKIPLNARKILDIGCAEGEIGARLKERQDCHVTGIEIFPNAAIKAAPKVDLAICGDALEVMPSLPDQHYDCILLLDVLEHVVDAAALLRLAERKLMKRGVLILCVPNVAHWTVIQELLGGNWDYADEGILDRTHLRFYTQRSLVKILEETGFSVLKRAATRVNGPGPSPAVIAAATAINPSGADAEVNLHSYQFIFMCGKTPTP